MKEKRFTVAALVLTALITLTLTLGGVALTAWLRLGPGGLAVLEGMELIQSRFVGELEEDVAGSALSGMVEGLGDRWSSYLSPEAYEDMTRRRENAYVGVGLTYQWEGETPVMRVVELTEGGPAEAAGIRVGDRITAVDGQTFTLDNALALAAGISQGEGEAVTFTVLDEAGAERQVTVIRAKVESDPVTYELLEGGVGYVRLANFYDHSAQRTKAAVDDLVAQGAKALLFDVRSNPGGYVGELTELLDYLLPEGPIFAEHTKDGPVRVTQSDEACVELPMAVLINADSYSAAELFAAQLRESVAAPLIGQQTCGKGYYQQAFPLPNGGALNLSTGMYTTGGGKSLIGVGLTPDVEEADVQHQLELAVETLREKVG